MCVFNFLYFLQWKSVWVTSDVLYVVVWLSMLTKFGKDWLRSHISVGLYAVLRGTLVFSTLQF